MIRVNTKPRRKNAPRIADGRPCAICGGQLNRRPTEAYADFANRTMCSRECYYTRRKSERTLRNQHLGLYYIWNAMIQRCTSPNNQNWKDYGGRGITVSDAWRDFGSFLRDMSPRPEGATLDRIDNDGGYSKSNCRWATFAEQNRNRRNTRYISVNGRKIALIDHCEERGLQYRTVSARISSGWTVERALNTPVRRPAACA